MVLPVLGPKLLHRDPESSIPPLLLVSEGCKDPGDSSNSQHSSDKHTHIHKRLGFAETDDGQIANRYNNNLKKLTHFIQA